MQTLSDISSVLSALPVSKKKPYRSFMNNPGYAYSEGFFDFSPDGSQMCFFRQGGTTRQTAGIYVMNTDGSDLTPLFEARSPRELGGCDWSPDGTKVAFYAVPGSLDGVEKSDLKGGGLKKLTATLDEEVYVINADGSGRTALTSNSAADVEPDWSPDGKKITFASTRDGDYEVYTMDADGSNVAQVTKNSVVDDMYPEWQPLPVPTPPKEADGSDVAQGAKKPGVHDVDRDRPERTVIVEPGDSLWSISERRLGPEVSPQRVYDHTYQMYALNRKMIGSDPDLIFAGQRLSLPPLGEG